MARIRLDNEQWDFGSNCFVCEPKNERGLGIPFFLDEEEQRIHASFTPARYQSGAPRFAHGGLSMAILDEGMNWAVIAIAHRFGLTRKAETSFHRPVAVGQMHSVACWVEGMEATECIARGQVLDSRGKVCVEMKASFYVMTKEEAEAALGTSSKQAQTYVRD